MLDLVRPLKKQVFYAVALGCIGLAQLPGAVSLARASESNSEIQVQMHEEVFQSKYAKPRDPKLFGRGREATAASMQLLARYWMPADLGTNPPKGIFVIGTHGLRESTLQRDTLAKRLVQEGFIVAGFDLPGHGSSPNMGAKQGDPDALLPPLEELSQEVLAFIQDTQHRFKSATGDDLPTIAYGHSIGGPIVADAVMKHPGTSYRDLQNQVKLAGTIVSHPALEPFLYQRPLVPVLRAARWVYAKAPFFPLPNFGFVASDYPGAASFAAGSPALNRDRSNTDGQPRVLDSRTLRESYSGQLHPAWTAVEVFNAANKRNEKAWRDQFRIDAPIVFIHPEKDLTTNASASLELAANDIGRYAYSDGRSHEVIVDQSGEHRHGEVETPAYLDSVVGYAVAMRDGKPPSTYKPAGVEHVSYQTALSRSWLGRLKLLFKSPGRERHVKVVRQIGR